jgi:hypothetical protein
MKKISILMFFVTLAASFDANAQTPSGKIGCNMQDAKSASAKIPTVTENLDWILHGTPISGIAYYNAKLQPGAAEYSANAAVARTASMQALCAELTAINFATKGELKKSDGKVVEITPDIVLRNEVWLKNNTESMKIDFGTTPMSMAAANLKTRSLDTVIHANGLGVQSVTVLKLKQGMFPLFLDLCGNESGPDFGFVSALVTGSAKIVEAQASTTDANLQAIPGVDPELAKKINETNQKGLDSLVTTLGGSKNSGTPQIFYIPVTVVTGGNNQTVSGGGQNGSNGKDGKDGTNSSSPSSIITTTTTPPANVDPFAPGTPGRSLSAPSNNAPQGWVSSQNQPTAQIACSTCPGAQAQAWNRQDVAYMEQQAATNNQYNAALLKQSKTQTGLQGAQLGVQIVGTGFQIADAFGAFNSYKVKPVVNVINRFFTGGNTPSNGGPSDFPNGLNGTISNNGGSVADWKNGF